MAMWLSERLSQTPSFSCQDDSRTQTADEDDAESLITKSPDCPGPPQISVVNIGGSSSSRSAPGSQPESQTLSQLQAAQLETKQLRMSIAECENRRLKAMLAQAGINDQCDAVKFDRNGCTYYCGKAVNTRHDRSTCGPNDGLQCGSCQRYQAEQEVRSPSAAIGRVSSTRQPLIELGQDSFWAAPPPSVAPKVPGSLPSFAMCRGLAPPPPRRPDAEALSYCSSGPPGVDMDFQGPPEVTAPMCAPAPKMESSSVVAAPPSLPLRYGQSSSLGLLPVLPITVVSPTSTAEENGVVFLDLNSPSSARSAFASRRAELAGIMQTRRTSERSAAREDRATNENLLGPSAAERQSGRLKRGSSQQSTSSVGGDSEEARSPGGLSAGMKRGRSLNSISSTASAKESPGASPRGNVLAGLGLKRGKSTNSVESKSTCSGRPESAKEKPSKPQLLRTGTVSSETSVKPRMPPTPLSADLIKPTRLHRGRSNASNASQETTGSTTSTAPTLPKATPFADGTQSPPRVPSTHASDWGLQRIGSKKSLDSDVSEDEALKKHGDLLSRAGSNSSLPRTSSPTIPESFSEGPRSPRSPSSPWGSGKPAKRLTTRSLSRGLKSLLGNAIEWKSGEEDEMISEVSWKPDACIKRSRSVGSHTGIDIAFDSPENAVIMFDWDDTLLPTTYLKEVVMPNLKKADSDGPIPEGTVYHQALEAHAEIIKMVLQRASAVGRVAIVTLATRWWISASAERYLPGLDLEALLEECGITVYHADRYDTFAKAKSWFWGDPGTHAKKKEMQKCVKALYGKKGADVKWNVISIGDAEHEKKALKELMGGKDAFCKTIKLKNSPTLNELSYALSLLLPQIGELVKEDKSFDKTSQDLGFAGVVSQPGSPKTKRGGRKSSIRRSSI